MNARIDAFNQVQFPLQAKHLPGPQNCKQHEQQQGQHRHQASHEGRAPWRGLILRRQGRRLLRVHHHRQVMSEVFSAPMPGIMLVFMWCMTQIEPDITMTSRTSVNTSAIMFQPPSAFEFK